MVTRTQKWMILGGVAALSYPALVTAVLPPFLDNRKQKNRTAIVTGATGKMGTALTYGLLNRNTRVIMACRDMESCRMLRRKLVMKTQSKNVVCRHLDLEDIDSINRFVEDINKTEPHVDILINCAGVRDIEEKTLTKYGIEKNFFVNYMAPFILTFRLLPKLEESAAITRDSRIINVIGGPKKDWDIKLDDINFDKRTYSPKAAYNQSKLALAYFTQLLDKQNLKKENCVYTFGTNPVFSNIRAPFERPRTMFGNFLGGFELYHTISVDSAIGSILKCALSRDMNDRKKSGQLYSYFHSFFRWPKVCRNEIRAKVVWNATTDLVLNLPDQPKQGGLINQPGDMPKDAVQEPQQTSVNDIDQSSASKMKEGSVKA